MSHSKNSCQLFNISVVSVKLFLSSSKFIKMNCYLLYKKHKMICYKKTKRG